MAHRVFVAITISPKLRTQILEWERSQPNLPVRWSHEKNLHITLIPPWDEEDVGLAAAKLRRVTGMFHPFHVALEKVTYGPSARSPRLIWAEGRANHKIVALKDELERITGVATEYNPWRMHMTLARFRREDFESFPVRVLDERIYWGEQVNSFVLMESHLRPLGSDYEILEEIPLWPRA